MSEIRHTKGDSRGLPKWKIFGLFGCFWRCCPCCSVRCIRKKLARGDNVLVCPGDYDLGTETLALNGQQSIIGMGAGVRFFYSGSGAAIACNTLGVTTSGRLSSFEVVGSGDGSGIRIGQDITGPTKSAQMHIDNIKVTGFARGIECIAAQICRFTNVRLIRNAIGLFCVDGLSNTQCLFSGLSVIHNSHIGVLINRLMGAKFDTCVFESNGEEGVCLHTLPAATRIQHIRFDTCWFENNNLDRSGIGHAEIKIENDENLRTVKVMLLNCIFAVPKNPDNFQIWIDNQEEVLFDNNRFLGGEVIRTPTGGTPPRVLTRGRVTRNKSISAFGPVAESADGDTNLDVHLGDVIEVTNSGPTTITKFTTFWTEDGDTVVIRVMNSNAEFINGTDSTENLRLAGGANYPASEGDVLTFMRRGDLWVEISRYAGGVA